MITINLDDIDDLAELESIGNNYDTLSQYATLARDLKSGRVHSYTRSERQLTALYESLDPEYRW